MLACEILSTELRKNAMSIPLFSCFNNAFFFNRREKAPLQRDPSIGRCKIKERANMNRVKCPVSNGGRFIFDYAVDYQVDRF